MAHHITWHLGGPSDMPRADAGIRLANRGKIMFAVPGSRIQRSLLVLAMLAAQAAAAAEIAAVLAHPPVDAFFSCTEHGAGLLTDLGDNLGQDCVVNRFVTEDGRTWPRAYATDGKRNEDWF